MIYRPNYEIEKTPDSLISHTLFAAEKLAQALGEAIGNGEKDEAAILSRKLSELAVSVKVNVDSRHYPSDSIKYVRACARVRVRERVCVSVCVPFPNHQKGGNFSGFAGPE